MAKSTKRKLVVISCRPSQEFEWNFYKATRQVPLGYVKNAFFNCWRSQLGTKAAAPPSVEYFARMLFDLGAEPLPPQLAKGALGRLRKGLRPNAEASHYPDSVLKGIDVKAGFAKRRNKKTGGSYIPNVDAVGDDAVALCDADNVDYEEAVRDMEEQEGAEHEEAARVFAQAHKDFSPQKKKRQAPRRAASSAPPERPVPPPADPFYRKAVDAILSAKTGATEPAGSKRAAPPAEVQAQSPSSAPPPPKAAKRPAPPEDEEDNFFEMTF